RFIRHSRDLGFSLDQIGELLSLWQDRRRSSRHVKALAQAHIQELDGKLQELNAMKATLEHLAHCCNDDDRPDCPIIETLADESLATGQPGSRSRRSLGRQLQAGRQKR
ncbi:MAG: MerR family DNA-binding protein, partial [Devosia sp.]|nr:MerR family DNA-binding protein [Devosia sp.]